MASGSGSDFIIQSENDSKPRLRGVRVYLDCFLLEESRYLSDMTEHNFKMIFF